MKFVKSFLFLPLVSYIIVLVACMLLPVSDAAYDSLGWRFLVSQAYALPVLIILGIFFKVSRDRQSK